jgi:hypothetical protein
MESMHHQTSEGESHALDSGGSQDQVSSESMAPRLLDAVEVGAGVGAFGYMALRAHWNAIGATSLAGIGIDRYLMEVYGILAGQLPFVLLIALLIAVVVLPLRWLLRIGPQRIRSFDAFAGRLKRPARSTLPIVLLILLVLAQLRLLQVLSGGRCATDVALGDLKLRAASHCYDVEPKLLLFYGLALLCIAGAFFYRAATADRLRRIVAVATLIIALQLPILYGARIKPPRYPGVKVSVVAPAAQPSVIGLLILQSDDAVELWTARNGRGEFVVVPRGHIDSMVVTDVHDLFAVASAVARDPAALPKACGIE